MLDITMVLFSVLTVLAAAAVHMIVLHNPDGGEIEINPEQVTSLRAAKKDHEHFSDRVHCLVNLADGKFVTVVESCDQVRALLEEAR